MNAERAARIAADEVKGVQWRCVAFSWPTYFVALHATFPDGTKATTMADASSSDRFIYHEGALVRRRAYDLTDAWICGALR